MPRKKTEPTEEPKAAVSRRAASKKSEAAETAESAEETKESAVAAPEEAEKAVRKKRTYVRRKSAEETTETEAPEQPAADATKGRRGRKKAVEEASGTLFPEEDRIAAAEEEKKTVRRSRRPSVKEEPPVKEAAADDSAPATQAEALPVETPAAPEAAAEADEITPEAALLAQASDGAAAAEEGGKGKEEKDEELAIAKEIEAAAETQDGAEAEAENAPEDNRNLPVVDSQKNDRGQIRHQHPKLGFNQLAGQTLAELRKIAKEIGVSSITTRRKDDLINDILKTQAEALGYRFNGGTLECMSEGYGFLRPSGLLPSSNDIYVSAFRPAQRRRRVGHHPSSEGSGALRSPAPRGERQLHRPRGGATPSAF